MAGEQRRAPRDWIAEIDIALETVISGDGPVRVSSRPRPGAPVVRLVEPAAETEAETVPGTEAERFEPFVPADGPVRIAGGVLSIELPPTQRDPETVRRAAWEAGRRLHGGAVRVDTYGADATGALVDGLVSGYAGRAGVECVVDTEHHAAAERGRLAAEVARLAGLLVSAPPNLVTPERVARWAVTLAERCALECTDYDAQRLAAEGFGGVLSIGAGSQNKPRLVRLRHRGRSGAPRVALVGKGVTFDSGGLSLKSPTAMQVMRLDVAGAATVLAVMAALRRAQCPLDVEAVLPLAENMPGPSSSRPGDVTTSWNGTQIQLLDLDFEGRVLLADALALACSARPDLVVDLATLTYQAEIALGPEIGAVLGRDQAAVDAVLAAAATAGEPMWPLPWAPRYLDQVRTPFGVRNHPLHDSGRALTAALFLGEFVPSDIPWAHCDITGPAWRGDASCDGGTGFGARTLLALLDAVAALAVSGGAST